MTLNAAAVESVYQALSGVTEAAHATGLSCKQGEKPLDFQWNPASGSPSALPAEWTAGGARESVGKLAVLASHGRENTSLLLRELEMVSNVTSASSRIT